MRSWDDLQPEFRRVVLGRRAPIGEIADRIPADRATVYRLMNGETKHPSRAIIAGVERLVDEVSQVRRSDSDDSQG